MDITAKVLSLLAMDEYGEITDATVDSKIKDLDIHSLDFICLVSDLEEEYGVDVPNDSRSKVVTVGDLVQIISDLVANKKSAA